MTDNLGWWLTISLQVQLEEYYVQQLQMKEQQLQEMYHKLQRLQPVEQQPPVHYTPNDDDDDDEMSSQTRWYCLCFKHRMMCLLKVVSVSKKRITLNSVRATPFILISSTKQKGKAKDSKSIPHLLSTNEFLRRRFPRSGSRRRHSYDEGYWYQHPIHCPDDPNSHRNHRDVQHIQ